MPFVSFGMRTEHPDKSGLQSMVEGAGQAAQGYQQAERTRANTDLAREKLDALQQDREMQKGFNAAIERYQVFRQQAEGEWGRGQSALDSDEELAEMEALAKTVPPHLVDPLLGMYKQDREEKARQSEIGRLGAQLAASPPGLYAPEGQTVTGKDGEEVDAQEQFISGLQERLPDDPSGVAAQMEDANEKQNRDLTNVSIQQNALNAAGAAIPHMDSLASSNPRLFAELQGRIAAFAQYQPIEIDPGDYAEASMEFVGELVSLAYDVPTVARHETEAMKQTSAGIQDLAKDIDMSTPEGIDSFTNAAAAYQSMMDAVKNGVSISPDATNRFFEWMRGGSQGGGTADPTKAPDAKPAEEPAEELTRKSFKAAKPELEQEIGRAANREEATRLVQAYLQDHFGKTFSDLSETEKSWVEGVVRGREAYIKDLPSRSSSKAEGKPGPFHFSRKDGPDTKLKK